MATKPVPWFNVAPAELREHATQLKPHIDALREHVSAVRDLNRSLTLRPLTGRQESDAILAACAKDLSDALDRVQQRYSEVPGKVHTCATAYAKTDQAVLEAVAQCQADLEKLSPLSVH